MYNVAGFLKLNLRFAQCWPLPAQMNGASCAALNCLCVVICNILDGRRPANLQTALVTWYAECQRM
jgi:hypothetical protein